MDLDITALVEDLNILLPEVEEDFTAQGHLTRQELASRFGVGVEVPYILWEGGSWSPGQDYDKQIVIKNASKRTLHLTYALPLLKCFRVPFPKPISIAPGIVMSIPITFHPESLMELEDYVEFTCETGTFRIPLIVRLAHLRYQITESVNFGLVPINEMTSHPISIVNTGELAIDFEWVTEGPFSIVPSTGVVPMGGRLDLELRIEPTVASIFNATAVCRIVGSSTGHTMHIQAHSRYQHLIVSESEVPFGDVVIGSGVDYTEKRFIIKNVSSVRATVSITNTIEARPASAAMSVLKTSFSHSPEMFLLQPSEEREVVVKYTPTQAQRVEHTELEVSSPSSSSILIPVSGRAIPPLVEVCVKMRASNSGRGGVSGKSDYYNNDESKEELAMTSNMLSQTALQDLNDYRNDSQGNSLTFSPTMSNWITFADVAAGESSTNVLTIANHSHVPALVVLDAPDADLMSPHSAFRVSHSSLVISPRSHKNVILTFSPVITGNFTRKLYVRTLHGFVTSLDLIGTSYAPSESLITVNASPTRQTREALRANIRSIIETEDAGRPFPLRWKHLRSIGAARLIPIPSVLLSYFLATVMSPPSLYALAEADADATGSAALTNFSATLGHIVLSQAPSASVDMRLTAAVSALRGFMRQCMSVRELTLASQASLEAIKQDSKQSTVPAVGGVPAARRAVRNSVIALPPNFHPEAAAGEPSAPAELGSTAGFVSNFFSHTGKDSSRVVGQHPFLPFLPFDSSPQTTANEEAEFLLADVPSPSGLLSRAQRAVFEEFCGFRRAAAHVRLLTAHANASARGADGLLDPRVLASAAAPSSRFPPQQQQQQQQLGCGAWLSPVMLAHISPNFVVFPNVDAGSESAFVTVRVCSAVRRPIRVRWNLRRSHLDVPTESTSSLVKNATTSRSSEVNTGPFRVEPLIADVDPLGFQEFRVFYAPHEADETHMTGLECLAGFTELESFSGVTEDSFMPAQLLGLSVVGTSFSKETRDRELALQLEQERTESAQALASSVVLRSHDRVKEDTVKEDASIELIGASLSVGVPFLRPCNDVLAYQQRWNSTSTYSKEEVVSSHSSFSAVPPPGLIVTCPPTIPGDVGFNTFLVRNRGSRPLYFEFFARDFNEDSSSNSLEKNDDVDDDAVAIEDPQTALLLEMASSPKPVKRAGADKKERNLQLRAQPADSSTIALFPSKGLVPPGAFTIIAVRFSPPVSAVSGDKMLFRDFLMTKRVAAAADVEHLVGQRIQVQGLAASPRVTTTGGSMQYMRPACIGVASTRSVELLNESPFPVSFAFSSAVNESATESDDSAAASSPDTSNTAIVPSVLKRKGEPRDLQISPACGEVPPGSKKVMDANFTPSVSGEFFQTLRLFLFGASGSEFTVSRMIELATLKINGASIDFLLEYLSKQASTTTTTTSTTASSINPSNTMKNNEIVPRNRRASLSTTMVLVDNARRKTQGLSFLRNQWLPGIVHSSQSLSFVSEGGGGALSFSLIPPSVSDGLPLPLAGTQVGGSGSNSASSAVTGATGASSGGLPPFVLATEADTPIGVSVRRRVLLRNASDCSLKFSLDAILQQFVPILEDSQASSGSASVGPSGRRDSEGLILSLGRGGSSGSGLDASSQHVFSSGSLLSSSASGPSTGVNDPLANVRAALQACSTETLEATVGPTVTAKAQHFWTNASLIPPATPFNCNSSANPNSIPNKSPSRVIQTITLSVNELQSPIVTISPSSGVLAPRSTLPITITFAPTIEGQYVLRLYSTIPDDTTTVARSTTAIAREEDVLSLKRLSVHSALLAAAVAELSPFPNYALSPRAESEAVRNAIHARLGLPPPLPSYFHSPPSSVNSNSNNTKDPEMGGLAAAGGGGSVRALRGMQPMGSLVYVDLYLNSTILGFDVSGTHYLSSREAYSLIYGSTVSSRACGQISRPVTPQLLQGLSQQQLQVLQQPMLSNGSIMSGPLSASSIQSERASLPSPNSHHQVAAGPGASVSGSFGLISPHAPLACIDPFVRQYGPLSPALATPLDERMEELDSHEVLAVGSSRITASTDIFSGLGVAKLKHNLVQREDFELLNDADVSEFMAIRGTTRDASVVCSRLKLQLKSLPDKKEEAEKEKVREKTKIREGDSEHHSSRERDSQRDYASVKDRDNLSAEEGGSLSTPFPTEVSANGGSYSATDEDLSDDFSHTFSSDSDTEDDFDTDADMSPYGLPGEAGTGDVGAENLEDRAVNGTSLVLGESKNPEDGLSPSVPRAGANSGTNRGRKSKQKGYSYHLPGGVPAIRKDRNLYFKGVAPTMHSPLLLFKYPSERIVPALGRPLLPPSDVQVLEMFPIARLSEILSGRIYGTEISTVSSSSNTANANAFAATGMGGASNIHIDMISDVYALPPLVFDFGMFAEVDPPQILLINFRNTSPTTASLRAVPRAVPDIAAPSWLSLPPLRGQDMLARSLLAHGVLSVSPTRLTLAPGEMGSLRILFAPHKAGPVLSRPAHDDTLPSSNANSQNQNSTPKKSLFQLCQLAYDFEVGEPGLERPRARVLLRGTLLTARRPPAMIELPYTDNRVLLAPVSIASVLAPLQSFRIKNVGSRTAVFTILARSSQSQSFSSPSQSGPGSSSISSSASSIILLSGRNRESSRDNAAKEAVPQADDAQPIAGVDIFINGQNINVGEIAPYSELDIHIRCHPSEVKMYEYPMTIEWLELSGSSASTRTSAEERPDLSQSQSPRIEKEKVQIPCKRHLDFTVCVSGTIGALDTRSELVAASGLPTGILPLGDAEALSPLSTGASATRSLLEISRYTYQQTLAQRGAPASPSPLSQGASGTVQGGLASGASLLLSSLSRDLLFALSGLFSNFSALNPQSFAETPLHAFLRLNGGLLAALIPHLPQLAQVFGAPPLAGVSFDPDLGLMSSGLETQGPVEGADVAVQFASLFGSSASSVSSANNANGGGKEQGKDGARMLTSNLSLGGASRLTEQGSRDLSVPTQAPVGRKRSNSIVSTGFREASAPAPSSAGSSRSHASGKRKNSLPFGEIKVQESSSSLSTSSNNNNSSNSSNNNGNDELAQYLAKNNARAAASKDPQLRQFLASLRPIALEIFYALSGSAPVPARALLLPAPGLPRPPQSRSYVLAQLLSLLSFPEVRALLVPPDALHARQPGTTWGVRSSPSSNLCSLSQRPSPPIHADLPELFMAITPSPSVNFSTLPRGAIGTRVIILENRRASNTQPLQFHFDPTHPLVLAGAVQFRPPKGDIPPGRAVAVRVSLRTAAVSEAMQRRLSVDASGKIVTREDIDTKMMAAVGGGSAVLAGSALHLSSDIGLLISVSPAEMRMRTQEYLAAQRLLHPRHRQFLQQQVENSLSGGLSLNSQLPGNTVATASTPLGANASANTSANANANTSMQFNSSTPMQASIVGQPLAKSAYMSYMEKPHIPVAAARTKAQTRRVEASLKTHRANALLRAVEDAENADSTFSSQSMTFSRRPAVQQATVRRKRLAQAAEVIKNVTGTADPVSTMRRGDILSGLVTGGMDGGATASSAGTKDPDSIAQLLPAAAPSDRAAATERETLHPFALNSTHHVHMVRVSAFIEEPDEVAKKYGIEALSVFFFPVPAASPTGASALTLASTRGASSHRLVDSQVEQGGFPATVPLGIRCPVSPSASSSVSRSKGSRSKREDQSSPTRNIRKYRAGIGGVTPTVPSRTSEIPDTSPERSLEARDSSVSLFDEAHQESPGRKDSLNADENKESEGRQTLLPNAIVNATASGRTAGFSMSRGERAQQDSRAAVKSVLHRLVTDALGSAGMASSLRAIVARSRRNTTAATTTGTVSPTPISPRPISPSFAGNGNVNTARSLLDAPRFADLARSPNLAAAGAHTLRGGLSRSISNSSVLSGAHNSRPGSSRSMRPYSASRNRPQSSQSQLPPPIAGTAQRTVSSSRSARPSRSAGAQRTPILLADTLLPDSLVPEFDVSHPLFAPEASLLLDHGLQAAELVYGVLSGSIFQLMKEHLAIRQDYPPFHPIHFAQSLSGAETMVPPSGSDETDTMSSNLGDAAVTTAGVSLFSLARARSLQSKPASAETLMKNSPLKGWIMRAVAAAKAESRGETDLKNVDESPDESVPPSIPSSPILTANPHGHVAKVGIAGARIPTSPPLKLAVPPLGDLNELENLEDRRGDIHADEQPLIQESSDLLHQQAEMGDYHVENPILDGNIDDSIPVDIS